MRMEVSAKDQKLDMMDQELTETKRKLMSLTEERNEEVDKLKSDFGMFILV